MLSADGDKYGILTFPLRTRMTTSYMTRTQLLTRSQQRTASAVHRLEQAKLRNAMLFAEPHKREFFAIVESAMGQTGFSFADCCNLVTLDRIAAVQKERERQHRNSYRSEGSPV